MLGGRAHFMRYNTTWRIKGERWLFYGMVLRVGAAFLRG